MSSTAAEQANALELARIERHVAQGEQGFITLLKRNAQNGLEPLLRIDSEWEYSDRLYDDRRVPIMDMQYELRIAVRQLSMEKIAQVSAVQHGELIFSIVQPSPHPPTGDVQMWRLWLMHKEMAESLS